MANQTLGQIVTIGIGILLLIMGSILVQRKSMNIPIGGRGGIRPIFSIPLRGIGAVIFGLSAILCGVLTIGFAVFAAIKADSNLWDNSISILQVIVIGGLLVGFAIGLVMQTLMLFVNAVDKSHKGN